MADEPVEVEQSPQVEPSDAVRRLLNSGSGRVDDDLLTELPDHLKSVFEEPKPGSLMHSIQNIHKSTDLVRGLDAALTTESTLDKFMRQNSLVAGFERYMEASSIGNQFAETQRKHEERLRELLDDLAIPPINPPAVKMVGLLNEMRDALQESTEHHKAQAEALFTQNEALFADAVRQEEQIRQLREANLSMRQAVQRAEADAREAQRAGVEAKRALVWGYVIGVIGIVVGILSVVVPLFADKK